MPNKWYAIHSQSRKEELLWNQILTRGIKVYYPRLRVKPVNPRCRKIRPYFPGYLFIHADLDASGISAFQWIPYSTGLVTFGGEPAIVPDNLIITLQQKIEEIERGGNEVLNGIKTGDPILITGGPFAGYEAIYDTRISGTERVKVLLKMLNQHNLPVSLDAGQIQRVTKKHPY